MVSKEEFEDENSFFCESCGFHYRKEDDAMECESFFEEKGICDSDTTSKSLERKN